MHRRQHDDFDTRDNALLNFDWGPAGTVDLAQAPAAPAQPAAQPAPTGAPGADFMGDGPLGTVGQEFRLNVRTGPGVDYPVMDTLAGGTTVEMLYRIGLSPVTWSAD